MYEITSENITELAKALLKVQGALPVAAKDAVNPFIKNKYASLNSIMEACREPLLANGILVTQSPCPAPEHLGGGYLGLLTRLTHAESGQFMSSLTVIPMPKNDPQGMGAAITYARRYALSAMLGIVSGDDGDCEIRQNRPLQTNKSLEGRQQIDELPKIQGVIYEHQKSGEGQEYVIAKGQTAQCSKTLKEAGFIWNQERKVWWKYTRAA